MMSTSTVVTAVIVEGYVFPPTVKAPGSHKPFFLGGSGVRGLEIEGKFVKFTAHGIYLEESAISALTTKWKDKTTTQLATCLQFFRDVITGPFEKLTQITMILPLTGKQFSEKVMENCIEIMKAEGVYGDDEVKAVEKFLDAFKDENFPAGSSVAFTQSPLGSLAIGFGKHDSVPEVGNVVIENKMLSEAVLDSIIGENGVNPEAKERLAATVSELLSLNEQKLRVTLNDATNEKIECTVVDEISGHQVVEA